MKAKPLRTAFVALPAAFVLPLLLLLLLGCARPAAAQPALRVGVKGGVDFAKLRLSLTQTERLTGLTAGVFGRLKLGSRFSLQPEVLYVQKGTVESAVLPEEGPLDITYSFDYIEVPVLLQLPLPIRGFHPLICAGPYFGVAVRKDISLDPENVVDAPPADSYEDIDYGLALGVGFEVPLGAQALTVEGRWTHGFYDLDPSTFGTVREVETSARTGTLAVTVGVLF